MGSPGLAVPTEVSNDPYQRLEFAKKSSKGVDVPMAEAVKEMKALLLHFHA
jgi:hypothetical protein